MIRIASFNANSINRRIYEINQFLIDKEIDIMCIQETWLSQKSIKPSICSYDWVGSPFSNRRGSGVGMFIKNSMRYNVSKIKQIKGRLEYIIINVFLERSTCLRIGCIYVHPQANSEILNEINNLNLNNLILCGDFNALHPS